MVKKNTHKRKEPIRYIDGLELLKFLNEQISGVDDTHHCPMVEEHTLERVKYAVEYMMGINGNRE